MGIVKISEELHEEVRETSAVMARSINSQAEYWIKIGMLAEFYPDLTYAQLTRKLLTTNELPLATLKSECKADIQRQQEAC
ncbi:MULTISPECIES: ParD-like family protein [unclassified Oceanobacter]|uniref:ParD-like family protein n=1 Tax=unclassified Oceanobacter TaxID=2620260 RepID=UPI002733BAF9|nr:MULTISPECIES: ParD-like family protein [unclassified Oceanobacter]MDP2610107.1 ParD-like family protein [Oceanobacter sp. 1_MG-2023]MDP2612318.1 ParD-like family protein [Oceanobacter sp. 2_MG-2023]